MVVMQMSCLLVAQTYGTHRRRSCQCHDISFFMPGCERSALAARHKKLDSWRVCDPPNLPRGFRAIFQTSRATFERSSKPPARLSSDPPHLPLGELALDRRQVGVLPKHRCRLDLIPDIADRERDRDDQRLGWIVATGWLCQRQ